MRLIQLSDCHLSADPATDYRGVSPDQRLARAVSQAAALRPDLVIASGDISDDGSLASFKRAAACLDRLGCRWAWLPGNHDDPAVMAEIKPLEFSISHDGWEILLLDTHAPGRESGRLTARTLERLDRRLAAGASPVLIAMHHPPVAVNAAWLDALGLEAPERFWKVVSAHTRVRGVLCGHVHHAFTRFYQGMPVMGLPAVSAQFLPESDAFALDEAAPGGFRLVQTDSSETAPGFLTRIERLTKGSYTNA